MKLLNLCDTCKHIFATCDGNLIFDEKSSTKDNVIDCNNYIYVKRKI